MGLLDGDFPYLNGGPWAGTTSEVGSVIEEREPSFNSSGGQFVAGQGDELHWGRQSDSKMSPSRPRR